MYGFKLKIQYIYIARAISRFTCKHQSTKRFKALVNHLALLPRVMSLIFDNDLIDEWVGGSLITADN